MRRERASAYQRQFLNEFASSSAQFIDLNLWDRCVDPRIVGFAHPDRTLPVWVGVDASVKHDCTAIVAVTFDTKAQLVRLIAHYVFQPTPDEPLNFEATIEATLLDLAKRLSGAQGRLRSVHDGRERAAVDRCRIADGGVPAVAAQPHRRLARISTS